MKGKQQVTSLYASVAPVIERNYSETQTGGTDTGYQTNCTEKMSAKDTASDEERTMRENGENRAIERRWGQEGFLFFTVRAACTTSICVVCLFLLLRHSRLSGD